MGQGNAELMDSTGARSVRCPAVPLIDKTSPVLLPPLHNPGCSNRAMAPSTPIAAGAELLNPESSLKAHAPDEALTRALPGIADAWT